MARKPKKRKYTKRSEFWGKAAKPMSYRVVSLDVSDWGRMSKTIIACTKPYASRAEAALAARNAASTSQPYVCATCGEWHARLRA